MVARCCWLGCILRQTLTPQRSGMVKGLACETTFCATDNGESRGVGIHLCCVITSKCTKYCDV